MYYDSLMCRLIECQKGQKLKVTKLYAGEELKHRLISFGIMKGAVVEVLEQAPRKKTIEVKVEKMHIALRAEEAQLIEVQMI